MELVFQQSIDLHKGWNSFNAVNLKQFSMQVIKVKNIQHPAVIKNQEGAIIRLKVFILLQFQLSLFVSNYIFIDNAQCQY